MKCNNWKTCKYYSKKSATCADNIGGYCGVDKESLTKVIIIRILWIVVSIIVAFLIFNS
jgi:hypothetical protein